jgi:hypothetical protein
MSYRIRLFAFEEASEAEKTAAERRFRRALDAALGDESLVLPVYKVYQKIAAVHGDNPSPDALSPEELEIVTQWQAAESAALVAALGPHRYMGDAEFEIRP